MSKRAVHWFSPTNCPTTSIISSTAGGGYVLKQVNGDHLKDLHIAWDAWWTREGVPQAESYQRPAPAFRDKLHWDLKDHSKVGRFLSLRNMKEADQFIPLVEGGNSSFNAPLIGVYKLNSDLKGNVIASTASVIYGVSEKLQAQYLPRTFICGFAAGIERIFWYNFINNHANKNYSESHFGLLTNTLGQKSAFKALKQLTRLLPGNSTVPVSKPGTMSTWPTGSNRTAPTSGPCGAPSTGRTSIRR